MKRTLIAASVFILAFISCEEGFEPTTEFKEDYIMYGIVNGDSTYQSVIISKSYPADNFDPYSNTTDPDVKNASVTLRTNGNEYLLKDTSIERTDNSRYSDKQYFYYTDNFKPAIGQSVEIEAVLPNGKVLNSTTTLPDFSLFSWADSDLMLPVNRIYSEVYFTWKLNNASDNLVFVPRFFIHYFQKVNGVDEKKVKEVPLNFVKIDGVLKEQFPSASGKTFVLYDTTIVYDAIKELKGNSSASDITIIEGEIELTIMDENFGSYYSTIQSLTDDYTIKIYETNFSNIEGGIGVWGSYFIKRKSIQITEELIERYGYKSYY